MIVVMLLVSIFYLLVSFAVCMVCGYPLYVALIMAAIFITITFAGVKALEHFDCTDKNEEN